MEHWKSRRKIKGKGSPVNGGWKESSGEVLRGIRSGAGNERKGGNAERVACIIFDKDNPQDILDAGIPPRPHWD